MVRKRRMLGTNLTGGFVREEIDDAPGLLGLRFGNQAANELRELQIGDWPAEIVALRKRCVDRREKVSLCGGFDAFGDDAEAEGFGERRDRFNDSLIVQVMREIGDK